MSTRVAGWKIVATADHGFAPHADDLIHVMECTALAAYKD